MYCWNLDEIKVFETMAVEANMNCLVISGTGINKSQPFAFKAMANSTGWYVEMSTAQGRRGSWQGSTFNLACEVAVAARRVL